MPCLTTPSEGEHMNVEQLEDLVKELRRATKSDTPSHWAYIAKGEDGKPVFMVRRKEPELTKALNDSRKEATDKIYAKGRTVVTQGALALGVDEGAATPANIKRDLLLLKKEPALAKVKDTLGADVLVDDAWDAVKPGARDKSSLHATDDDLGDLGGANAKAKGGTIKKDTSDFAVLVKALDDWRDGVRGEEMNVARVHKAMKDLKAIEVLVDNWEAHHAKSVFDSKKTKERRTAVADIRKNLATARTFLDQATLIAQVGASVTLVEDKCDGWDSNYRPLPPNLVDEARRYLVELQKEAKGLIESLEEIDAPAPRKKWVTDRLESLMEELDDRNTHVENHAEAYPLVADAERVMNEFQDKWANVTAQNIVDAIKEAKLANTAIDNARQKVRGFAPSVAAWATPRLEGWVSPLLRLTPMAAVFWDEAEVVPFEKEVAKLLESLPVQVPENVETMKACERLIKRQGEISNICRNNYASREGHRAALRQRIDRLAPQLEVARNVIALAPLLAEVDSIGTLFESWQLAYSKSVGAEHIDFARAQLEELARDTGKVREALETAPDSTFALAWIQKAGTLEVDLRAARDQLNLVQARVDVGALDPTVADLAQPILQAIVNWDAEFGTFHISRAGIARGGLEAIDAQIAKARDALSKKAKSPERTAAEGALDRLASESGRRRTKLDTDVSSAPPTPQELQQFAEGEKVSREKAIQEEGVERDKWSKKVQSGLDEASYKVGKKIGRGGFGTVYLLQGDKDAPLLACKTATDDELKHEAEIYKKVPPHPNIVRSEGVREIEVNGEKVKVLVLQALTGGNMEDLMEKGKKALDDKKVSHLEYWGAVQYMARSMLRALQHFDAHGLAHNDVKPENMMLDVESGELKMVDMGTVQDRNVEQRAASSGYMGGGQGEKRDGFAVGASVYQGGQALTQGGKVSDARFDYDGAPLQAGPAGQAVNWTKKAVKALRKNPPKEGAKGTIGVASAYSDWVNRMMEPDATKRMSFAESLKHPFLSDMAVDEDTAKKTLKQLSIS